MFCYSNIVDKELKYNQYIFIYSIDSHASHPKEQCCSEKTDIQSLEILWRQSWWRHCKVSSVQVQPNQRWPHKSSLEWWKHHKSQFPLLAKLVKVVFPVQNLSGSPPRRLSWILRRKRTLRWWSATWGCLKHGLQKLNCYPIDWLIASTSTWINQNAS